MKSVSHVIPQPWEESELAEGSTRKRGMLTKAALVVFALMPFHVLLIYFINSFYDFEINDIRFIAIKMWKEVVIVGVVLIAFVSSQHVFRKFMSADWWILVFVAMGGLYTLIAQNVFVALWSFRALFEIFLFYLFGRMQSWDLADFARLLRIMFGIGILTSLFGVYQVEVLGEEFHTVFYGWEEAPIQVTATTDYERIRATSTFVSVHEFGLFLVLQIFALPFLLSRSKHRLYYTTGGLVLLIGLIYSFSRSSILILILGLIFMAFRNKRDFLWVGLFVILAYVLLDYFDAFRNILSVVAGVDSSVLAHQTVLEEALQSTLKDPLGVGMGEVGVVVRRFNPNAPQYEGEWFNVLVQLGIIGGVLFLLIYASFFRKVFSAFRNSHARSLALFCMLILLAMIAREFILPRDPMNSSLGWFVLGAFMTFVHNRSLAIKGSWNQ